MAFIADVRLWERPRLFLGQLQAHGQEGHRTMDVTDKTRKLTETRRLYPQPSQPDSATIQRRSLRLPNSAFDGMQWLHTIF